MLAKMCAIVATVVALLGMVTACSGGTSPPAPVANLQLAQQSDGCPAGRYRVNLVSYSDPAPDVTDLVMCRNLLGTTTTLANNGDDMWLVRVAPSVRVEQVGGVPASVQIFREFRLPTSGWWLEPGTTVSATTGPAGIGLVIDRANQVRWAAFKVLDQTSSAALERAPDLVRNEKYRAATASCLDAAGRVVSYSAEVNYNTQTLLSSMGLVTGGTQCAADLRIAERERQSLALATTGRQVADLQPSRFAERASTYAGYLDDILKVSGKIAQVLG